MVASKKEREVLENELHGLASQKKRQPREKVEGGSLYAYDPNAIDIDYAVIKKFGALGVAPPSSQDTIEKTEKELRELRDALNVAGRM
jgi:hypothetical protein